jgi:hypothetical protein
MWEPRRLTTLWTSTACCRIALPLLVKRSFLLDTLPVVQILCCNVFRSYRIPHKNGPYFSLYDFSESQFLTKETSHQGQLRLSDLPISTEDFEFHDSTRNQNAARYLLHSTLKTEATCSSETSANFQRNTRRYIITTGVRAPNPRSMGLGK